MFFTEIYRLYVQGVRRALRERLEFTFGEAWWERGVEHALLPEQLKVLKTELERYPNLDRLGLLDAAHFGWIIEKNHNEAFSDSFPDSVRTFKDFRRLTFIRNEWAHVREISLVRSRQASDLMKHILASLRCVEALEIDKMSQGYGLGNIDGSLAESIPESGQQDGELDSRTLAITPLDSWRDLRSYLVLEKSVELPEDETKDPARVTVLVYNTAPDSRDLPTVEFRSVVVKAIGQRPQEFREFGPGQTRQLEFTLPVKQLVTMEFEIAAEVDINRLCEFRSTTHLPHEVIEPLRQEFMAQLESIGIKEYIDGVLQDIGAPNANMTLRTSPACVSLSGHRPKKSRRNILL
jgi:hypothetical protein